jgi:leucyl aminopeptidase
MDVHLATGELHDRRAGLAALGMAEGGRGLDEVAARFDRASGGAIAALLASGDFRGRFLETALLYPRRAGARRLLLVGLGRTAELTDHRMRLVAGQAARRARELEAGTLALAVPREATPERAQAIAEGVVLGHYRFSAYRSEGVKAPLSRAILVAPERDASKRLSAAVARGARWGEAVALARDLASTPGEDLPPEGLAARATEIAKGAGARIRVLRVPQLERLGAGALLAVGRGSPHPPCMIVLERGPAGGGKIPTVALIGKGVTFDTGGISIKPREGMNKMKYDLSGGAAVLAVFSALDTLSLRARVVGIVPAAENMPDGRAFKPGDVLRPIGGVTVEVTNTDAEGRLLLADALGYARTFAPDVVIDLATLTGAISVALGTLAAGLFTDDDALAAALTAAGETQGERLWRMPLWDDYAAELKSDTADLVNSAAPQGAAILAAVFLKRFARGLRWAHLDIASTGWTVADRPHEPRGPTGFGVRLLLEWLSRAYGAADASPAARPARRGARSRAG